MTTLNSMNTLTQEPCAVCDRRDYASYELVSFDGTKYRVCGTCIDNAQGPGKFERVAHDDVPLALVLYGLGFDSADHWLTDDYNGAIGQFDRYLLIEQSDGFVELREHRDADAAVKEMNGYEDDGFGAQEDDAYISYDGSRGIAVSFGGKFIGSYERLTRAQAAVSLEMRKSGYYPNVWLTGEHGPTIRRIDVW